MAGIALRRMLVHYIYAHLMFLLAADKLSDIDIEFSLKSKERTTQASESVEERLLSYQRKVELAATQKANQDLDRWKRLEIETIQVIEREKQQKEVQDRRRQVHTAVRYS